MVADPRVVRKRSEPLGKITFRVAQVIGLAPLRVEVYDLVGQRVAVLWDQQVESAAFAVPWNGRDESGGTVAPGLYLVRATVEGDWEQYTRVGIVGVAY